MRKLVLILLVFIIDSSIAHTFAKTGQENIWLENNGDVSLASSSIFDVRTFGAKGNGKTDDSKAFQAAWLAACKISGSILLVPRHFNFLVYPITFSGSCASTIIFQMDGDIIAPTNVNAWKSSPQAWILFEDIHGITLQGNGVLHVRGSIWWKNKSKLPGSFPLALMFSKSSNIMVTGITIKDGAQKHLKVYECSNVKIFSMTIVAPGDSPGTDGINLAESQQVVIHDINVSTGDDCISILQGCNDVEIYKVNCGPSHGISIGGLGRKGLPNGDVSNIIVRDSSITDSMTGVRIKSFQGGEGLVQRVNFSNIELTRVKSAIVIDQYYCDGDNCKNDTSSGIKISGLTYKGIKGTYIEESISLLCSDPYPCKGLIFSDINLKPSGMKVSPAICSKAYGKVLPPINPPITCLNK